MMKSSFLAAWLVVGVLTLGCSDAGPLPADTGGAPAAAENRAQPVDTARDLVGPNEPVPANSPSESAAVTDKVGERDSDGAPAAANEPGDRDVGHPERETAETATGDDAAQTADLAAGDGGDEPAEGKLLRGVRNSVGRALIKVLSEGGEPREEDRGQPASEADPFPEGEPDFPEGDAESGTE